MPKQKSFVKTDTKHKDNFFEDSECFNKECNAKVTHESHCMCHSHSKCPKPNIPVKGDLVVVKIPVVLSETTIRIPVIAHIKLESKAVEIKRIRKNVFLTQCHLIPGSVTEPCHDEPATGVLVIEGFVRKNIEFATKECKGRGVMSGRINHTTVEVPFSCTTTVTFDIPPVFVHNSKVNEIELLKNRNKDCDECSEGIQGIDTCERDFNQTEFFNERVFCELVSATIFESDINEGSEPLGKCSVERSFDEITEKMVIDITLKLLQKQQVKITSEDCDDDCFES